jgi:cytochrome c biogenesis protein CcmG/thiol:disulfide interchange protein DsbE
VVAGSAVLAVALATRFGTDPGLGPSPLLGQPAPDVTLPRLDGTGELSLTSLTGEIVVVNFFASWCLECRTEHDDLVATSEAYAGSGVQFVQIAYEDTPEAAMAFLTELGTTPETIYLDDPDSRAAIGFGLRGVPETFFIDPEGIVRGKISGESNAILLAETIDTMLAGEDPGAQVVGQVQSRPDD